MEKYGCLRMNKSDRKAAVGQVRSAASMSEKCWENRKDSVKPKKESFTPLSEETIR